MKQRAAQLQTMTIKAYQLGEIDLLTLLNAQQTYLTSEQRFLSSLRDYYIQLATLEKYIEKELVF
jgi:cobalt-zinc-cadmium efflux system outer membrane protein